MSTDTCTSKSATNMHTGRISFLEFVRHMFATRRQRRTLRSVDPSKLNDIGLTRSEADKEASRPIWDVPTTWLR